MKPVLAKYMRSLDRSYENVISFELSFLPDIIFIGCYITPKDSPYYDAAIYGYIQGILKRDTSKTVFIMGDLNSRIGVPDDRICNGESLDYYECEDLNVNDNGKNLLMLCEENNVVVVNNLRYRGKHFNSKLSFRKKNAWISEPDALVVSVKGLELIDSFNMVQYFDGKHLYSDHALLEFILNTEKVDISTALLKQRVEGLGVSVYETATIKIHKTLRVSQCNVESIAQYFLENNPPVLAGNENIDRTIDSFVKTVSNVLKENKLPRTEIVQEWGNQAKWTRLIENNDLRTIWKAIG